MTETEKKKKLARKCQREREDIFNASCASSCRVSLTLNMYFASLKYTSPTFVTSMVNTISSMTFVIAIILR